MKVLINGAGVTGLSTAWRLATAGATVHILDPRVPGGGASHAALGAFWPPSPLAKGPLQNLHRESLKQFEAFARMLAKSTGLPVTYRRPGRIEILNSAKATARARQEAAADATFTVMDAAAAQKLNPGLAAFTHGALHCSTTAQVIVREYIAALVKACHDSGVVFHEGIAATGLLISGERIAGIQTAGGLMEADAYLVNAGAWTPLLSPLLAGLAPVIPAKGQGLAIKMPSPRPITTIIKSGAIYLIPWDDEILVGSTTEPGAGFDEAPTDFARRKLLAGAAALLPALQGSVPLRHWTGLRPYNSAAGHLPVMGPHPELRNLYICAGHYKVGIGISPSASALMSECITQGRIPPALVPFLPRQKVVTETRSPANP
jgi:glycine oxidase